MVKFGLRSASGGKSGIKTVRTDLTRWNGTCCVRGDPVVRLVGLVSLHASVQTSAWTHRHSPQ